MYSVSNYIYIDVSGSSLLKYFHKLIADREYVLYHGKSTPCLAWLVTCQIIFLCVC